GYSVEITPDGGFLFAGATASYGLGYYDAYLVKTDVSGLVEWEYTYGGTLDDRAYALSMTSDGGYLMVGTTESFGAGSADLYAVKVDPMGEVIWSQTFGGSQSDNCRAVVKNRAGQFVLVGCTYSYSAGGSDLYLVTMSGDQATPVVDPWPNLPDGYELSQNYPNPFNLSTRIEYSVPRSGSVNLTIFNLLGQVVKEWQFRQVPQGTHSIDWDGRTESGEVAATGVYFYRIEAGDFTASRKMLLMK
ncbi:MAG TPA: FlgD immunoglobulin-like domain containing protein, partial [Candidatus Acidoferrum sp.]|nr:FlgD immunoglobulin-like domain containing protein [Candidatus Acidoferrum sp.]